MRTPTTYEWAALLCASLSKEKSLGLSPHLLNWAICLNTGRLDNDGRPESGSSCLMHVQTALAALGRNNEDASERMGTLRRASFLAGDGENQRFTVASALVGPKAVLVAVSAHSRWLGHLLSKHQEEGLAFFRVLLEKPEDVGKLLAPMKAMEGLGAAQLNAFMQLTQLYARMRR